MPIWLNKHVGTALKVQSKPFIVLEIKSPDAFHVSQALSTLDLPAYSFYRSFGHIRVHFWLDISNVPGLNDYGTDIGSVRSKYRTGLRYQVLSSVKERIANKLLGAGLAVKLPMEDRIAIAPEEILFINEFWKNKNPSPLSSIFQDSAYIAPEINPKVDKFVDRLMEFAQEPLALLEITKWHGENLTVAAAGIKKAIQALPKHKTEMKQAMSENFHLISFLTTKKNRVGLGVEFIAKHFFGHIDTTTACYMRPIIAYALNLKLQNRYIKNRLTDDFQYHLKPTGVFSSAWLKANWYESKVLKLAPLIPGNGNTYDYIKYTAPVLLKRLDPDSVIEIMKEQIDFSDANDKTTRKGEISSYVRRLVKGKKNVQNLR